MTATSSTVFVVETQALGQLLAEKDAEIERLKALLIRAADALEEEFGPGNTDLMTKDPWALIGELRKAAE